MTEDEHMVFIESRKVEGETFAIYFNKHTNEFNAIPEGDSWKGIRAEAKTIGEVIEGAEHLAKQKRSFKPLEAIDVSKDKIVRITSFVKGEPKSVWIGVGSTHEKGYLSNWSDRNEPNFVLATPRNVHILQDVKDLDIQIEALEHRQRNLRKSYDNPVTRESLGGVKE